MLRPELRDISPNDCISWETFATADHPQPWDEFGWFTLEIGLEGEEGTTRFQVLAATPAAVSRAKGTDKQRRVLVVDSFEPHALETTLRNHVSKLTAHTWDEIVERLRRNMYWEYENLRT